MIGTGEARGRERDRFRIVVPILIAVVSVLGAVVAMRASQLSIRASDLNETGLLQFVQREQELAAAEAAVDEDLRLLAQYQGHIRAWRLLEEDAGRIREDNPELAEALELQAQGELALARSLRPFFQAQLPDFGDREGVVEYDREEALRFLVEGNQRLQDLRPAETLERAREEHGRTVNLVLTVALFIAALVFLTVAQFASRSIRGAFAVGGVVVALAGVVVFVVLEAAA